MESVTTIFLAITAMSTIGLAYLGYRWFISAINENREGRTNATAVRVVIGLFITLFLAQAFFWSAVVTIPAIWPQVEPESWWNIAVLVSWGTIWVLVLALAWYGERRLELFTITRYGIAATVVFITLSLGTMVLAVNEALFVLDPPPNFTYGEEVFRPIESVVEPGTNIQIPLYGTRRNEDSLTILYHQIVCPGYFFVSEPIPRISNVIDEEASELTETWGIETPFIYQYPIPGDVPAGVDCRFLTAAWNIASTEVQTYEVHFSTP